MPENISPLGKGSKLLFKYKHKKYYLLCSFKKSYWCSISYSLQFAIMSLFYVLNYKKFKVINYVYETTKLYTSIMPDNIFENINVDTHFCQYSIIQ